ncbi:uncharacterized protein LOC118644455 [Monomorium pharaonis]|uniref:uncharacterized protein LOC118644455 n=1 Tax=Monomorium pharaonis TaxID=307658 RepID=UPI001746AB49|nr:uncharacterized protein LOC118644455 [Monomorium pharaonis]
MSAANNGVEIEGASRRPGAGENTGHRTDAAESRKRHGEVDVGTDELVGTAPVVESPCHCEQLAAISRGPLLPYAPGCEGSPRDAAASGSGGDDTASRGCGPKTRGSVFSAVRVPQVVFLSRPVDDQATRCNVQRRARAQI